MYGIIFSSELDQKADRHMPRSQYSTQMSETFSDEDQPRFWISPKVKFGQPDTETETEEQWEKPSKKKTSRRKKYDIFWCLKRCPYETSNFAKRRISQILTTTSNFVNFKFMIGFSFGSFSWV